METKQLTLLEKQYPAFEQSKRMSELGMSQDECLAHWGIDQIYKEYKIITDRFFTGNGYKIREPFKIHSIVYPNYKAFTIQQMEEFVFSCLNWVDIESITLERQMHGINYSRRTFSLPKRSGNYSFFDVQLGLIEVSYCFSDGEFEYVPLMLHFPTLAQAYAALCIYILENFKPAE